MSAAGLQTHFTFRKDEGVSAEHSLIEQFPKRTSGGWSVSLYVQLHPAVTSPQPSSRLKMRVRVASASVALIVTENVFNQRSCLG